MKRIQSIRNPFQDMINALNAEDVEATLRTEAFLEKSRNPIPDDINNQVFPMTDIIQPNVLKPEDLSMKDLLHQIQTETILMNNIAPFVEKKIKSEVTQSMIKDFQNEMAKPVEINGTFYKFRPPDVSIDLKEVPPDFPDEETYQANIFALIRQELEYQNELSTQYVKVNDIIRNLRPALNDGSLSPEEFNKARNYYEAIYNKFKEEEAQSQLKVAGLEQDWRNYNTNKTDYNAKMDLIKKENAAALKAYEDEIKARNTGFEAGQQEEETDEEYAQRLLDTGHQTVDPASVELQAKSFLYNSVKDRLNEVMPTYKTEAVLNAIVTAGGYEKLQPIKDQWPGLKKKLEEVFGDVSKVENTDSIAQILFNYSMKPTVRPSQGIPLSSTPVTPSPNITPLPRSIVPTKPTTKYSNIPIRFNPPTGNLIDTVSRPTRVGSDPFQKGGPRRIENFIQGQELKGIMSTHGPQLKENARLQREQNAYDLAQEQKYAIEAENALRKEQARQIDSDLKTNILIERARRNAHETRKRGNVISSLDFALDPTARFHSTEVVPYSASERINRLLAGPPPLESVGVRPRLGAEDLGPRYEPIKTRSKSLEQRSRTGRPISLMSPSELKEILERNGKYVYTGNVPNSKQKNYDAVVEAGLLPQKPNIIPREEFESLSNQDKALYLESQGMRGKHGGYATQLARDRDLGKKLTGWYDRYANESKTGRGLSDIKSQFAIIDGEIQAGNNNPQLIRDARKLLKEMVQQKLVTLYEAQTHMKHLRKINKI